MHINCASIISIIVTIIVTTDVARSSQQSDIKHNTYDNQIYSTLAVQKVFRT